MAVKISPENQRRIQEHIDRGVFKDADDFVTRTLDLTDEIERRRARLAAIIDESEADIQAGRVYEMTPELWAQIRD